jgi:gp32 DNA binding protein like
MAYNLDLIKQKLNNLANKNNRARPGNKEESDKPKLKYFKPEVGSVDIRVLPFTDGNGQPVQEVLYYDSKFLTERRFVSPAQFGLEDPINDMFTNLSSGPRVDKNVYKMLMQFKPKAAYYLPVLVRGREDEGVMFWELNERNLQKLYMSTFANPDWEDENLTDPDVGHDFSVAASDTGKVFGAKNSPVLEWAISVRKKASKLAKTADQAQLIISSIPDVLGYQKQYVKSAGKIQEILDNALAGGNAGNAPAGSSGTSSTGGKGDDDGESDSVSTKNSKKAIEDAFADL